MSLRQTHGQLYEVSSELKQPGRPAQIRNRSADITIGSQYATSYSSQPAVNSLNGLTRNYLGEVVTNIYSAPLGLQGRHLATAENIRRSAHAMDDRSIRRSTHSNVSLNRTADNFTNFFAGQKFDEPPRVIPYTTPAPQQLQPSIPQYSGVIGHHEVFSRPYVPSQTGASERNLSIGSHDRGYGQSNLAPLLSPKGGLIARGPLSDAGSVSSARMIDQPSLYGNNQDFTQAGLIDPSKGNFFGQAFISIRSRRDTESEHEFRPDTWREQQNLLQAQIQPVSLQAFHPLPPNLIPQTSTGSREPVRSTTFNPFRQADQALKTQPVVVQAINDGVQAADNTFSTLQQAQTVANKSPTDARKTWPNQGPTRILNSDDFRSLLQTNQGKGDQKGPYAYQKAETSDQPIGKTEYGDKVYGFDEQGRPIIEIDPATKRPILGYAAHNKSPVYGFSRSGLAQTHFDSLGRPVVGFDTRGNPVYDLKSCRYPIKALDNRLNAILGYTRDKRPVYDVSSAGYIATSVDSATGQLSYGLDWKWRQVLEKDVRDIEEYVKTLPVVGTDPHRAKIYGFDQYRNPVLTFTKDHKPVYGYTVGHFPVMSIDQEGYFVLTFDPNQRPVYGFLENLRPIYNNKHLKSGQKVFYPPGVEFPAKDLRTLLDVWGREVDKTKINPRTGDVGALRKASFASAEADVYDFDGQPTADKDLLLDYSGRPLPGHVVLTNSQGQIITPGTPVYNQRGELISKLGANSSPKNVVDSSGKSVGVTFDGVTVVNEKNMPIATLAESGKLKTLVSPVELVGLQQNGSAIMNKDGQLVAHISREGLLIDGKGIHIGKINSLGQIELDEDLAKEVEKASRTQSLIKHFVPQLTLPNGQGKDALFSESDRGRLVPGGSSQGGSSFLPRQPAGSSQLGNLVVDLKPNADGKPRFQVTARGDLVDTVTGSSLGRVADVPAGLKVSFASHISKALLDGSGQVGGYLLKDGSIVNLAGMTIGQIDTKPESQDLQYFLSESGESYRVYNEANGLLTDQTGSPIGRVRDQKQGRDLIFLNDQGAEVARLSPSGRLTGKVEGVRIPTNLLDRVLAGEKIPHDQVATLIQKTKSSPENTAAQRHITRGGPVAGYTVDPKGQLLDKSGTPVARIQDGQLIDMQGRSLGTFEADGSLRDLNGHLVSDSGAIIGADGKRVGQFRPVPTTVVFPIAPSLPVIADVEGHKVIGVTLTGELVIGIDDQSQPILGKMGYNKDGVKITAIDIDGRPLSQSYVEEVIKISTAAGRKNIRAGTQQVVIEADEDAEDTERLGFSRRSLRGGETRESGLHVSYRTISSPSKRSVNNGEEEDDNQDEDGIGGESGYGTNFATFGKTASFIDVPHEDTTLVSEADALRQRIIFNEIEQLESMKQQLEQQIYEHESSSGSPLNRKRRLLPNL